MEADKGLESKEKLFEENIDYAVIILTQLDKITLWHFYKKMEEEHDCHETIAKFIIPRMESAGVIDLPVKDGTEYIQLKEESRVVWEGWRKWQEGMKHDVKMPRALNNKELSWYNQTLSFNKWREWRAWGTLVISAGALIISIIRCSS